MTSSRLMCSWLFRTLIAALSILTGTAALAQSTVTLSPEADTYVQNGTPQTNYGTAASILVRAPETNGTLTRYGYFQFDLATLPAGTITAARLEVFGQHDTQTAPLAIETLGGTNTAKWSETQVTWNNAFVSTGVDPYGVALSQATVGAAATYQWDVTAFVNSRRIIGHATIALRSVVADPVRFTFNSREATTNRPRLVITYTPTGPGGTNWPAFGHDNNNSRNAVGETTLGKNNIASLAVKHRVPGSGVASTPAVVDGVAYYSDFGGNLRAVNATTGATVWSIRLQNSMLTPSPAVTADSVYIGGDGANVFAVNRLTGALRWSSRIENAPSSRISGSPVVVGNTLIIGVGSVQVANPSPTLPFRGKVIGLNTTTGAIRWTTPVCTGGCTGVSVWSTAAIDTTRGLAYIGTGQAYTAPAGPYSDALVAINYNTGAIVWAYQFTPNDVYTWPNIGLDMDYDVGAAPNVFDVNGAPMIGVADKSGSYAVMRRDTGALQWRVKLGFGSRRGGVMGSTAYANGSIYVIENTSIRESARNASDSVPGTGTAFSLDAATGRINWSRLLDGGSIGAGVAYANGIAYVMTWDGRLRAIDAATGVVLKTIPVGTAVGSYVSGGFPNGSASGPSIYQGRIYAGYGWTWGGSVAGGLSVLSINGQ